MARLGGVYDPPKSRGGAERSAEPTGNGAIVILEKCKLPFLFNRALAIESTEGAHFACVCLSSAAEARKKFKGKASRLSLG